MIVKKRLTTIVERKLLAELMGAAVVWLEVVGDLSDYYRRKRKRRECNNYYDM